MKQEYVVRRHGHFDHHRGYKAFNQFDRFDHNPHLTRNTSSLAHLITSFGAHAPRKKETKLPRLPKIRRPRDESASWLPQAPGCCETGPLERKKACDITLWVKDSKGIIGFMSNTHFGDASSFSGGFSFTKMWRPTHTKNTCLLQSFTSRFGFWKNNTNMRPIRWNKIMHQVIYSLSHHLQGSHLGMLFAGHVVAMSSAVQDRENHGTCQKGKLQILPKRKNTPHMMYAYLQKHVSLSKSLYIITIMIQK